MDLIQQIQEVEKELKNTLNKFQTHEVLRFKKNDSGWNALEILEHLNIVDNRRLSLIEKELSEKTNNDNNNLLTSEAALLALFQKTQQRQTFIAAPEYALPKGIYSNVQEGITIFCDNRKRFKTIVEKHSVSKLEATVLSHARLGDMNIVQWIVYLNGHTQRHIAQLEDILNLHEAKK